MPEGKRTFKVGESIADIPAEKIDGFMQTYPDAIEVKSFIVDKDTADIPLDKVDGFLKAYPNAKPLFSDNTMGKSKPEAGSSPSLGTSTQLPELELTTAIRFRKEMQGARSAKDVDAIFNKPEYKGMKQYAEAFKGLSPQDAMQKMKETPISPSAKKAISYISKEPAKFYAEQRDETIKGANLAATNIIQARESAKASEQLLDGAGQMLAQYQQTNDPTPIIEMLGQFGIQADASNWKEESQKLINTAQEQLKISAQSEQENMKVYDLASKQSETFDRAAVAYNNDVIRRESKSAIGKYAFQDYIVNYEDRVKAREKDKVQESEAKLQGAFGRMVDSFTGVSNLITKSLAAVDYMDRQWYAYAMGNKNDLRDALEDSYLRQMDILELEMPNADAERLSKDYFGSVNPADWNWYKIGNDVGQVTGSMIPIMAASLVNPALAVGAGTGLVYGDLFESAKKSGMEDNQAALFAGTLSTTIGGLERMSGVPVTKYFQGEIGKRLAAKYAKDLLATTSVKDITKAAIDVAYKGAKNMVGEVATEVAQEGVEGGSKMLLNEAGFDFQDAPESLGELGSQMVDVAKSTAVGITPTIGVGAARTSRNAMNQIKRNTVMNHIIEIKQDPEFITNKIEYLGTQRELGKIDEKTYEGEVKALTEINDVVELYPTVSNDNLAGISELYSEKLSLQEMDAKRVEKGLPKSNDKRISEIDKEIVTLSQNENQSNQNQEEEVAQSAEITEAEYNDFIDNGVVTEQRISSIAEKVKANEPLSERETEIFSDKTAEINKKIAESVEQSTPMPEGVKVEGANTQTDENLRNEKGREKGRQESLLKPENVGGEKAPSVSSAGSVGVGGDVEAKRIETEAKIKRKDLFSDGGVFANELGGSGVNSVPTNHSERNGIEFVQFSNPNTGIVDVIMTGKSDNDFVGYYRIYENGKATNKWSSKFENQSRNKEDFKTMISGVQEMLPQGHEYTEKTSISTDGLRIWNQQLNRGYELQYDNKGNLITNRVAINGDAINNELGIAVNKGNFENVSVTNNADMKKVKEALLPYLQKFGLNESNIHFENGTVEIDLPVLKSNKAVEQSIKETPQSPTQEVGVSENPALKDVESTAKALEGKLNKNIPLSFDYDSESPSEVSEAYHKAKKDGSNPELVKAVEELLKPNKNAKEQQSGQMREQSVQETTKRSGDSDLPKVNETKLSDGEKAAEQKEVAEVASKAQIKPQNLRDLYNINRQLFGQNKIKSLASAIVMDRMIGAMAKRAGTTKAEMYGKLKFEKASEEFVKGLSAKGKVLFQLVGENAQLAQDVRDNLQVAKNMETAGKDAKSVRMATGWEKGKDGKWRYEILDGDVTDAFNNQIDRPNKEGIKLSDSLKDTDLFKLYPKLLDVNVRLYMSNDGTKGSYDPSKKMIYLNLFTGGANKSILLHEIQHAIQEIEGFAKGGSSTEMNTPNDVLQKLASPLNFPKLSKEDRLIAKQKTKEQGLRFSEVFYFDVIKDDPYELEDAIERLEILNKISPNESYVKLIEALDYKLMEMKGVNVAFEKYNRLAGEVEARNVQTRMGMTPEQRRETLLSKTEDVARDEQIVLFDSEGIKMQVDAWHGSPYEFDKFLTAFMGKGEGKQAFGWGLYFTDLEGIARSYANKLSELKVGDLTFDTLLDRSMNSKGSKEKILKAYDIILDFALRDNVRINDYKSLKDYIESDSFYEKANGVFHRNRIYRDIGSVDGLYNYIEDILNVAKQNKSKLKSSSSLYKVSLQKGKTSDQYTWLEWDKKVSKDLTIKLTNAINNSLDFTSSEKEALLPINSFDSASGLYRRLSDFIGQKEASLFLLENGIDGVKYPAESIARGATSDTARGFNYVVFDENAVSIDEVIKFQKDAEKARGAMMITMDGEATIYALTDPNVSTPLHEMAHVFEHYLTDAEKAAVQNWAGTKAWTTQTSEKFARGFEKYLAEGKAPTSELQKIFDKFKTWLTDIYNGITNSDIDIELNDSMREIYSKMLGVKIPTQEKSKKTSKESAETKAERRKRELAELKKAASDVRKVDGIDAFEQAKRKALADRAILDFHIKNIKEDIGDAVKTIKDYAKSIGESIDEIMQDAWDVVTNNTPIPNKYNEPKKLRSASLATEINRTLRVKNAPIFVATQKAVNKAFAIGEAQAREEFVQSMKDLKSDFKEFIEYLTEQNKEETKSKLDSKSAKFKAFREGQKAFAKVFNDTLKSAQEKNFITPFEYRMLARRASLAQTEGQWNKLMDLTNRVLSDASYRQKLAEAERLQKQAKQKKHGQATEEVKRFTRISPEDIDINKLDEYIAALGDLTLPIPKYGKMQAIVFEIEDNFRRSNPDLFTGRTDSYKDGDEKVVKAFERAEEAFNNVMESLNKNAITVDDYRYAVKQAGIALRNLDLVIADARTLYENDKMTPDDFQVAEQMYLDVLDSIGTSVADLSAKFPSQIDQLVTELVNQVNDNLPKIDKSTLTNSEKDMLKKLELYNSADLKKLSPIELDFYNQLIENFLNEGYFDMQRFKAVQSALFAATNKDKTVKFVNDIKQVFDDRFDNMPTTNRLAAQVSASWQGALTGFGKLFAGAFDVGFISPIMTSLKKADEETRKIVREFRDLQRKHGIQESAIFGKESYRERAHRIGMVAAYLREHGLVLSGEPRKADKKEGGQMEGERDVFRMLGEYETKDKDGKPKMVSRDKGGNYDYLSKTDDKKLDQKIYKSFPKSKKVNQDGMDFMEVDPKEVYDSIFTDPNNKFLNAKERAFLIDYYELLEKTRDLQQAANAMRGLPFKPVTLYSPRQRYSTRSTSGLVPFPILKGGRISLRGSSGKEVVTEELSAMNNNIFDVFMQNAEETMRDYYVTSAVMDVNSLYKSVMPEIENDNGKYVKAMMDKISDSLNDHYIFPPKDIVQRTLNNFTKIGTFRIFVNIARTAYEVAVFATTGALRMGTGYKAYRNFGETVKVRSQVTSLMNDVNSMFTGSMLSKDIEFKEGRIEAEKFNTYFTRMFASAAESMFKRMLWYTRFQQEFKQKTGQKFDIDKYESSLDYRKKHREAIEEAKVQSDKSFEFIAGSPVRAGRRKAVRLLPIAGTKAVVDIDTVFGQALSLFTAYPFRGAIQAVDGLTDLKNEPSLKRANDAKNAILGTLGEQLAYGFATTAGGLALALTFTPDDDEEEKERIRKEIDDLFTLNEIGLETLASAVGMLSSSANGAGRIFVKAIGTLAYSASDDKDQKEMIVKFLQKVQYGKLTDYSKIKNDLKLKQAIYIDLIESSGFLGLTELARVTVDSYNAYKDYEELMDLYEKGTPAQKEKAKDTIIMAYLFVKAVNIIGALGAFKGMAFNLNSKSLNQLANQQMDEIIPSKALENENRSIKDTKLNKKEALELNQLTLLKDADESTLQDSLVNLGRMSEIKIEDYTYNGEDYLETMKSRVTKALAIKLDGGGSNIKVLTQNNSEQQLGTEAAFNTMFLFANRGDRKEKAMRIALLKTMLKLPKKQEERLKAEVEGGYNNEYYTSILKNDAQTIFEFIKVLKK